MNQRRVNLVPAFVAESEARGANMAYLRSLPEGSDADHPPRARQSILTITRGLITGLRDSAYEMKAIALRGLRLAESSQHWIATTDSAGRREAGGSAG